MEIKYKCGDYDGEVESFITKFHMVMEHCATLMAMFMPDIGIRV